MKHGREHVEQNAISPVRRMRTGEVGKGKSREGEAVSWVKENGGFGCMMMDGVCVCVCVCGGAIVGVIQTGIW